MDYYAELQRVLPGQERTIGGTVQIVPAICPFCGKSNEREFHSSYGAIFDGDYGFKCFSCGVAYPLSALYSKLTGRHAEGAMPTVTLRPTRERAKPYWKKQLPSLMVAYTGHPDRYTAWHSYRRISQEVAEKYQLGVGILPQSQHRDIRLIVPILEHDGIVMLRGRRIDGDGPKWTSAGGVSPADIQLPFAEHVDTDILFIVENPIDAILINEYSRASAVAALSTNYWYPHWTAKIKALKPSIVITAYDHDLAGEGVSVGQVIKVARERIAKIYAARGVELAKIKIVKVETSARGWRIHWQSGSNEGILPIPAPAGVQRRNELLKAGIQVASMPWKDAADKCDIGDLYIRSIGNVCEQ